jgi:prepilin-type N-terminal cleavage/methylation domain-containing protein/prepilin-type processing-associated H-X9-DG protein
MPGRFRKGFTLIELLLVVSIIALLVAILLPMMSRARGAAHQVNCATRMNQIYKAMRSFTTDEQGYWPAMQRYRLTSAGEEIEWSWRGLLYSYSSREPRLYDCPVEEKEQYALGAYNNRGEPTPGETLIPSGIGAVDVHYNQGRLRFRPPFGRYDPRYPGYGSGRANVCRDKVVVSPAKLIVVGDGNSSSDFDRKLYYYPEDRFWIYRETSVASAGYNRANIPQFGGKGELGLGRHGNKYDANYGFADGNVQLLDANNIPCNANECWWDAQLDPH